MAWLTKPSGTTQIPRRSEPYLTPVMRDELLKKYIPRYETRLACTLPALHMVQHEYGWIPPQAMEEIADCLGIQPADVLDTASFYEEYWLKPKGRHLVSVCRSLACEFCGQPDITQAVKDALGIDVGETTDDGEFTLIELECIGACAGAPSILIDEHLHENVKPAQIPELLAAARTHKH